MIRPKRKRLKLSREERICTECLKRGRTVLMSAGSTRPTITYYYCPEDDCSNSVVHPRPEVSNERCPPKSQDAKQV